MDRRWLPEGRHTGLHIEHSPVSTGSFSGGGKKGIIHITVSPWFAVDAMNRVLHDKGAEVHALLGGRPGWKLPVLIQQVALDQFAKALVHPASTPETNRANCWQMEICATVGNALRAKGEEPSPFFHMPEIELPADIMRAAAKAEGGSDEQRGAVLDDIELCMLEDDHLARSYHAGVASFTEDSYKAIANSWMWIAHRTGIPARTARASQNTKRFTGQEFVNVSGYCGHMHVPGNTHYDPTTAYRMRKTVRMIKQNDPYKL